MVLLLGTKAPNNGLPTNCPIGLATHCYLKLGGIPFNLTDQPHHISDKFPYIVCEEFIEFEPDLIEKLKQSNLANLDYWITPDSEEQIRLGRRLIHMKLPGTEDETGVNTSAEAEVHMLASQLYPLLSRILDGKPFFIGDRPTSLDAYFFGHAMYVLYASQGTALETLLQEHPNLVKHASKHTEQFIHTPTNWLLETPREFHFYQIQYFFSKGMEMLGSGSFGEVVKGWIVGFRSDSPGAMPIAIKRSHNFRARDEKREYENEMSYLQKLRHPNIIQLLGYTQQGKQYFLIYELMQNGSVSRNLHVIDWEVTAKVALGSAEAMKYLHSRVPPIIFSDFKSANIVLDKHFSPKLTDFGIAEEEGKIAFGGTWGFTDRVTILSGIRSKATDMFSMGALLLQLITKEPNPLLAEAPEHWEKQLQHNAIVHPSLLESGCSQSSARGLAHLALKCISTNHDERPTIEEVIETLEKILQ